MNRQEVARLRREVEELEAILRPEGPLVAIVAEGEAPPPSAILVFRAPPHRGRIRKR